MVHVCNPSTWEARQKDHECEDSLGYIERPYLENKQTKSIVFSLKDVTTSKEGYRLLKE
jgi:hypothetical protein